MNFKAICKKTGNFIKKNSPTILAVGACGGVVATAVMSAKATPKALRACENAETTADKIKAGWKYYLPTAASAALTCAAILTGDAISRKQKSALVAATAAATAAYQKLDNAVRKVSTPEQQEEIKKEMAKEAPHPGDGEDLFWEPHYGYFCANKADVLQAIIDCNEVVTDEDNNFSCPLEYFFNQLGIDDDITRGLDYLGWNLLDIDDNGACNLIRIELDDGVPLEPECPNCLRAYTIRWVSPVIECPEEYFRSPFASIEHPEE